MSSKYVRLFFALWPDESARKQIMSLAGKIRLVKKGHLIRPENLHMTLHFIGNTSLDNMHCLAQKALKTKARPFPMELNILGAFKKPGIIWLGCNTPPSGLFHLQHSLGAELVECDYAPEKRKYQPHVTLYRKAIPVEHQQEIEPVTWFVDSFSLIQSENDRQGVIYREIRKYPLSVND